MYNQNWHVVYGPAGTSADIAPDVQVTEAVEVIFRMDGKPHGSPGPEIVVSVYGAYADPNGQRDDGSWPDVIVETQVAYQVREADGEVNDTDYEYTQGDMAYPADEIGDAVKREVHGYVTLGDRAWNWNGESAMQRAGGPVPGNA